MAHNKGFKDESQDARRHDQNKAEHADKKQGKADEKPSHQHDSKKK